MLQDSFEVLASGLGLGCYCQWKEESCKAPCKGGEEHFGPIGESGKSISKGRISAKGAAEGWQLSKSRGQLMRTTVLQSIRVSLEALQLAFAVELSRQERPSRPWYLPQLELVSSQLGRKALCNLTAACRISICAPRHCSDSKRAEIRDQLRHTRAIRYFLGVSRSLGSNAKEVQFRGPEVIAPGARETFGGKRRWDSGADHWLVPGSLTVRSAFYEKKGHCLTLTWLLTPLAIMQDMVNDKMIKKKTIACICALVRE